MSDQSSCIGILDASHETVVLGFSLVTDELSNLPARLVAAVQSSEVQSALTKALNEVADDALKKQISTYSGPDAKDFVRNILTTSAKATGSSVVNQIKQSSKFQQLEKQAQSLLDSLQCSPVGVWFDKNDKWIYLVAAGAALGGAVSLYFVRSGDAATEPIMSVIKDKPLKFKPFGKLEISGQITKFTPSKQEVGLKVFAAGKWEKLEAKFSLSVDAVGPEVKALGTTQIMLPLSPGVIGTLDGTVDPQNKSYSLGLGIDLAPQKIRLNLLASIKDNKFSGGSFDISSRGVFKPLNVHTGISGKLDVETGGYLVLGTLKGNF